MTHEVAKVTHREAVLASSGIKWEENIIVNRWGMGIFWAQLYNKSAAKKLQHHEIEFKQKRNRVSLTLLEFKLGRIYDPQE